MSLKKMVFTASGSAVFLLFALGSANNAPQGPADITNYSPVPVGTGIVDNADVKIVAEDNSFELDGGQSFNSPFQSNIWILNQTDLSENGLVDQYQAAERLGARKVLVYVKDRDQPLHGVLVLSSVYAAAYGPGAHSYLIRLPQDKIAAAIAGNTAVMYEKVNWRQSLSNGAANEHYWFSWILWLSSSPM